MGLKSFLQNFRTGLTQQDRFTITKAFGSFKANQFAMNGENFLGKGYESNVDVYAVIKKIVDTAKNQKFVIEQQTSEGWEMFDDSTLESVLMNPNKSKGYTFEDILEMLLTYLLASGNGILKGSSVVGFGNGIQELDVLPSNHVCLDTNDDFFNTILKYSMKLDNKKYSFETEDIGHVRYYNPLFNSVDAMFWGLSPIQVAAQVVQSGNDRWNADANLLQNRGAIGLITDKSNHPMLPDEAEAVQNKFQQRVGGSANFGKTIVTNKDLNYIQMAMSSSDLQLLEKGVINLRAMCNVFGLDSSLFNDPANKTFNNRKEAEKALYTNAVQPTLDKVEAELNRWLVASHYPEGNVRLRFDYSEVPSLQIDQKTEAEKDKIVLDGVNTVLNMPITTEGKSTLLADTYDYSQEEIDAILSTEEAVQVGVDEFAVIPEAANANAEAQANLRGSVGGVQGILAIQQGVASGVTSPSAAVATMVEIYGFDEATARTVLGL
jgi:HK97 family phage portal protein